MRLLQSSSILLTVLWLLSSCNSNNVSKHDELKKYFDEHKVIGTFAIYDNGQGHFDIYNLSRYKDSAYLPASTFKIVNALVGLQIGRIVNEKMVIPWDGKVRSIPEWNKNLTMEEAFKVSAVPYFQEVARRIGRDTMQTWLDSLKYGNHTIGARIDSIWLDNSLKITSDESLGLIEKLYFRQLPFQKRVQDIVRKLMIQESNSNYQLAYKTGWGFLENGHSLGWMVGWIEENKHPYFFVLNLEGEKDADIVNIRKKILYSILTDFGFFKGKR